MVPSRGVYRVQLDNIHASGGRCRHQFPFLWYGTFFLVRGAVSYFLNKVHQSLYTVRLPRIQLQSKAHNPLATLGQGGHSLNCSFDVDGANIDTLIGQANTNATAYHTEVYSANFPDGSHTLHMNVTSFGPSTSFWADLYLDYILYTPSPSIDPPEQQLWSFDDVDPAFNYSGPWSTADGTVQDFQSTLHRALSLNSSASLQFNGASLHTPCAR
jgi:hypothetical protein